VTTEETACSKCAFIALSYQTTVTHWLGHSNRIWLCFDMEVSVLVRAGKTFWRHMPKLPLNFKEVLLHAFPWEF
jgi:uncharacterized membrane protein YcaP (DUF421 family)